MKIFIIIALQFFMIFEYYCSVGPRRPSDQSDAFVAGFLYMFLSIYISMSRRRVPTSFPWVQSRPLWRLLFKKANHLPGSNRIDWPRERVRPGEVVRHPRWPNFSSSSVQACTQLHNPLIPVQIVERMSRNWRKDTMPGVYLYGSTTKQWSEAYYGSPYTWNR